MDNVYGWVTVSVQAPGSIDPFYSTVGHSRIASPKLDSLAAFDSWLADNAPAVIGGTYLQGVTFPDAMKFWLSGTDANDNYVSAYISLNFA